MKRVTVILITSLILLMIVGCQTSSNKPLTQDQNQTNNLQSVNNNQTMVNKYKNLAEQVPGVSKAYVAISNSNMSSNNSSTNSSTNSTTNSTNNRIGNINTNPSNYSPGTSMKQNDSSTTNNTSNMNNYTTTSNTMVVMVGLKLDSTNNNPNMSNIEKMVESKIKNADSRVTQVLVTTDSGMISEINAINNSIKNGTSMTNIQTSINNLTRRLTTNQ